MKIKEIIFDKPCHATLSENEFDEMPAENEVMVKTLYTLVSAGTESAVYRGTESWAKLPFNPGYASVGEIQETGKSVKGLKAGDIIFNYTPHRAYSKIPADGLLVKTPCGIDLKEAVFTRMAAVSITSLRVAPPELGDQVLVYGAGIVGNLAAQLFSLSGANVAITDISDKRLETARNCGLKHTVNSGNDNVKAFIDGVTGNSGVNICVEATGMPSVIESIFPLMAKNGEVVLLGSPRSACESNLTKILEKIHLWSHGCITLKGAHEWRYPLKSSPFCKHSIQRNCEIIMGLIADQKLKVKPLISHVVSPTSCQEVYQELINRNDKYSGVIFDWNKI